MARQNNASVAQLVEQKTLNLFVVGSNPTGGTTQWCPEDWNNLDNTFRVMVLKYKVPLPLDYPKLGDLDFSLHLGTFLLHVPPLIAVLEESATHEREWLLRRARNPSGEDGLAAKMALIEWLRRQEESGSEIIEWDGSQKDLIWIYGRSLIFSSQFDAVYCPACVTEYLPSQGNIGDWGCGGGLAAIGGRRLLCPCGHTLYAATEWNS